jgi:hypothetical protein
MRKAMVLSSTINLILIAAGAIVILGFIIIITPLFYNVASREPCYMSVYAQWASTAGAIQSPFPLECKHYFVQVTPTSVDITYPETNSIAKLLRSKVTVRSETYTKPEQLYGVLAEELRQCWWQFHEGKILIGNKQWLDWGNNELICYICDEVHLTDGVKPLDGFWQYIRFTNMSNSPMTYSDYLFIQPSLYNDVYAKKGNPWFGFAEAHGLSEDNTIQAPGDATKRIEPGFHVMHGSNTYYIVFVREGVGWSQTHGPLSGGPTFWVGVVDDVDLTKSGGLTCTQRFS